MVEPDTTTQGISTSAADHGGSGAKQAVSPGYRTAAEIEEAYNLPIRFLRMAIITLEPLYQRFGTRQYKYYAPAEQEQLRNWVEQAVRMQFGSVEDGGSIDFFGQVQMIGLDGQLRTYIPQAAVIQQLPTGGEDAVIFACMTYWTRVMIEWQRARHVAGAIVDYRPRPHELACIRFNVRTHRLTWVQQDSIPAFLAYLAKPKPGWQRGVTRARKASQQRDTQTPDQPAEHDQ